jgi:hypothetical protein
LTTQELVGILLVEVTMAAYKAKCSDARVIIDNFRSHMERLADDCKVFKDRRTCKQSKHSPAIIEILDQINDELDDAYCMRKKSH